MRLSIKVNLKKIPVVCIAIEILLPFDITGSLPVLNESADVTVCTDLRKESRTQIKIKNININYFHTPIMKYYSLWGRIVSLWFSFDTKHCSIVFGNIFHVGDL